MGRPRKPILFHIDAKTGCHICTSHATNGKGYPIIVRDGKLMTVVRYQYQLRFGSLPTTTLIRHTCDNRKCINLDHVLTGDLIDNMRDRNERGRTAKGERHGNARLSKKDVAAIRRSKAKLREIAERFNIGLNHAWRIRSGRRW